MSPLPPPTVVDADGRVRSAVDIAAGILPGLLGSCVACGRTCWSWWSPAPPSDYVPLHSGCVGRLRDLWYLALEENGGVLPEEEASLVPASGPRGAYARRRSVAPRATRPVATTPQGIRLPEGFTPGPFWRPGMTHAEPWVVLVQTGRGQVFAPFGPHRDAAARHLRTLDLRPLVTHVVPVVGAVLLSPDGGETDGWGERPEHGVTRWAALTQLSTWSPCPTCDSARWPGSWVTVSGGRCRGCVEPTEVADPRPWPPDPAFPGLATAPHWLGGPKPHGKRSPVKDVS